MRLKQLERDTPIELHATPDAMANAACRLIAENPDIPHETARIMQARMLERTEAMKQYALVSGLDPQSAERALKTAQIGTMFDGAADPMLEGFHKAAKVEFDRKLKSERKLYEAGAKAGTGLAATAQSALTKQTGEMAKLKADAAYWQSQAAKNRAAAEKAGATGLDKPGKAKGAAKPGGKGGQAPGVDGYKGCFICGGMDHRAQDCPKK